MHLLYWSMVCCSLVVMVVNAAESIEAQSKFTKMIPDFYENESSPQHIKLKRSKLKPSGYSDRSKYSVTKFGAGERRGYIRKLDRPVYRVKSAVKSIHFADFANSLASNSELAKSRSSGALESNVEPDATLPDGHPAQKVAPLNWNPPLVEKANVSFHVAGGPVMDYGTISLVFVFCLAVLIIIAIIYMQQRTSTVSSSRFKSRKQDSEGETRSTKSRSYSVIKRQTDIDTATQNYEVEINDGDDVNGYFATRRRLQYDNEIGSSANYAQRKSVCPVAAKQSGATGIRTFPADFDAEIQVVSAGNDDGLPDNDSNSSNSHLPSELAGFSEEDDDDNDNDGASVAEEGAMFNYRTVDEEVDDLEENEEPEGGNTDHSRETDVTAGWSSDDSDSDHGSKNNDNNWVLW